MQFIERIKQYKNEYPVPFYVSCVLIVLFLGLLIYSLTMVGSNKEPEDETANLTPTEAFIEGKSAIVCDYILDDGNEGRGYFQKDGTYSLEQYTNIGTYHLIKLEDHGYIWRAGESEGFRLDTKNWNTQYNKQVPILDTKTMELSTEGTRDVECDQTDDHEKQLFTPPEDVKFRDPIGSIE